MKDIRDQPISRSDFISLAISLVGAAITIALAVLVFVSQSGIGTSPFWLLPGLILLDWALLGLTGLIAAYLSFRLCSTGWLRTAWFITGAFIPLIILGQLSIGPLVLIGFLLFLISTVLLTFPRHPKWLGEVGLFLLGAVANLGLLLLLIYLGNPGVFSNLPY